MKLVIEGKLYRYFISFNWDPRDKIKCMKNNQYKKSVFVY